MLLHPLPGSDLPDGLNHAQVRFATGSSRERIFAFLPASIDHLDARAGSLCGCRLLAFPVFAGVETNLAC